MSEGPLVKVFLASYQRVSDLRAAIASVLAQRGGVHYRLLLYDDASTDGSAELCREVAAAEPERVEAVCRERNAGLRVSFNHALDGLRDDELLAVFAHDDLCHPDRLERSIDLLDRNPAASFAYSDAELVDERGKRTGERFSDRWGEIEEAEDLAALLAHRGNSICATSVTLRGRDIRRTGLRVPEPIELCIDYYAWIVLAAVGPAVRAEKPWVDYRVSAGQMTMRYRETQREQLLAPILAWRATPELRSRVAWNDLRRCSVDRARQYLDDRRVRGELREALWYARFLARHDRRPAGWFELLRILRSTAVNARRRGEARA